MPARQSATVAADTSAKRTYRRLHTRHVPTVASPLHAYRRKQDAQQHHRHHLRQHPTGVLPVRSPKAPPQGILAGTSQEDGSVDGDKVHAGTQQEQHRDGHKNERIEVGLNERDVQRGLVEHPQGSQLVISVCRMVLRQPHPLDVPPGPGDVVRAEQDVEALVSRPIPLVQLDRLDEVIIDIRLLPAVLHHRRHRVGAAHGVHAAYLLPRPRPPVHRACVPCFP